MRLVFMFFLCVGFVIQQHHLNQERKRLALLIAVVEHDQELNKSVHPELLEPCTLPQYIEPPYVDLGLEKEREQ
jgi:hypothetical protein